METDREQNEVILRWAAEQLGWQERIGKQYLPEPKDLLVWWRRDPDFEPDSDYAWEPTGLDDLLGWGGVEHAMRLLATRNGEAAILADPGGDGGWFEVDIPTHGGHGEDRDPGMAMWLALHDALGGA